MIVNSVTSEFKPIDNDDDHGEDVDQSVSSSLRQCLENLTLPATGGANVRLLDRTSTMIQPSTSQPSDSGHQGSTSGVTIANFYFNWKTGALENMETVSQNPILPSTSGGGDSLNNFMAAVIAGQQPPPGKRLSEKSGAKRKLPTKSQEEPRKRQKTTPEREIGESCSRTTDVNQQLFDHQKAIDDFDLSMLDDIFGPKPKKPTKSPPQTITEDATEESQSVQPKPAKSDEASKGFAEVLDNLEDGGFHTNGDKALESIVPAVEPLFPDSVDPDQNPGLPTSSSSGLLAQNISIPTPSPGAPDIREQQPDVVQNEDTNKDILGQNDSVDDNTKSMEDLLPQFVRSDSFVKFTEEQTEIRKDKTVHLKLDKRKLSGNVLVMLVHSHPDNRADPIMPKDIAKSKTRHSFKCHAIGGIPEETDYVLLDIPGFGVKNRVGTPAALVNLNKDNTISFKFNVVSDSHNVKRTMESKLWDLLVMTALPEDLVDKLKKSAKSVNTRHATNIAIPETVLNHEDVYVLPVQVLSFFRPVTEKGKKKRGHYPKHVFDRRFPEKDMRQDQVNGYLGKPQDPVPVESGLPSTSNPSPEPQPEVRPESLTMKSRMIKELKDRHEAIWNLMTENQLDGELKILSRKEQAFQIGRLHTTDKK